VWLWAFGTCPALKNYHFVVLPDKNNCNNLAPVNVKQERVRTKYLIEKRSITLV
jgi:hypothetical protein